MAACVGQGLPVLMRLAVLQHHVHLRAVDAASGTLADAQLELMIQAEPSEFGPQVLGLDPQVDHGGQVHVAAYSGEAVIVEYFHGSMRLKRLFPVRTRARQANSRIRSRDGAPARRPVVKTYHRSAVMKT